MVDWAEMSFQEPMRGSPAPRRAGAPIWMAAISPSNANLRIVPPRPLM